MNLSKLAKPSVAASVLAVLAMGCSVPTEDDVAEGASETIQQSSTETPGLTIAGGTFGVVNGAFTAYVTLDNFIKYGAPNANDKILGELKTANEALKSLQVSQAEQFRQLKVDNIILTINDLEDKIGRAWGEYDDSTDKANFVPSELKWSDFDMLSNRLASVNGTTDSFTLVKDGMLQKTGGIADDPLGVYALRMRTRLAQAAFLLTVKTGTTPSQQAKYGAAVIRLETSFAKATRAFFVARVAPATASGNTSACYKRLFGSWAYDTPDGGSNGGWDSFEACEADSELWGTGTVANARKPVENTVWSEQDALATGKWKRRPGTVVVKSASMTTKSQTKDVTKAMDLVCNSVENCSIPRDVQFGWLGGDPRDSAQAWTSVTVQYSCGDGKADRASTFPAFHWVIVLACNLEAAVAGAYQSTGHDADPGRGPDDTLAVYGTGMTDPSDPLFARWSYVMGGGTLPILKLRNDPGVFQWLRTSIPGTTVLLEWNDDGRVIRIGRVNGTPEEGFDFVGPAE
jgi:hypothetical protein